MNSIQSAPFPSQSMLDDFSATAFATSSKRNFEDGVILSTSLNPLEQLTSIAEQQQQHAWAILNDQSPAKKQRRASFGSSRRSSLDDHALMLQRPSSPLEALVMALENSSPEGDASEQSMQVCDGMAKVDPTDANMMNASHSASHSTGRRRSLASGERKIYACEFEGCNKHFMQLAHLRIHERCHTGLRPYGCDFPGCDKAFTQLGNLKTHERKHTGERPYKCPHEGCEKSFTQLGNLKTHERIHASVKPFICNIDECGKGFSQLGNLKTHQNKMHSTTIVEFQAKPLIPLRERQLLPAPTKGSSPLLSPPATPLPLPQYYRAQSSGVRRESDEIRLLYKVKSVMQKKGTPGRRGEVPLLMHEDDGSEASDELE